MNKKSTIFDWDSKDFGNLLKSCRKDEAIKITQRYLTSKKMKFLEAGCGLGRVVVYFSNKGYKNIYGVEINKSAVDFINQKYPKLNVINCDLLKMPFSNDFFDVIASYGVVEHFPDGLEKPLKALYKKLKPGGTAIISVPSMNHIRKFLTIFDYFIPRRIQNKIKYKNKYKYYVFPPGGNFFEYRLTKGQFENACVNSGFQIVKSMPIYHIDGMHHIFGNWLVKYENWEFTANRLGTYINNKLKKISFLHNHMHLCVLKKPI